MKLLKLLFILLLMPWNSYPREPKGCLSMAQNRIVEGQKVVQCYLSQDPIRLKGGLQLYSYVYDANTLTDVLGLFPDNSYYRFLSESDLESLNAGEGIKPKGVGTGSDKILEHVQGKDTGYISMSQGKLDPTYDGGLGAVKINPDKVPNVVSHENVLQAVKKDRLALTNALRAQEVLAKGPIPHDAIEFLSDAEIKKLVKCKK